jgi:cell division protein FtsW
LKISKIGACVSRRQYSDFTGLVKRIEDAYIYPGKDNCLMNIRDTRSIALPVLLLVGIGTVMVYSSTALMSIRKFGNGFHYLLNHLVTICAGIGAIALMSKISYKKLRPLVYVMLAVSFFLLLLVFVPGIGHEANGAKRWLKLWPTTFQPSELVKLVMVIFLADYMDKNIHRMNSFRHGIMIPAGVMLLFQAIIMTQPDFGAVMSLGILTFSLLLLGGARLRHMGVLVLSAVPVIYLLIMSSQYRAKRILCFLDPWKEPYDCGFQLVQSFIAFGNGSFFGLGLGGSKQKLYFLPEVHTDFIYSLIGEELGLLGALVVLGIFLWLFIKGIRIARNTCDPFSYFLTLGLTLMIGVQAIINFAVSTGLMPTKGLPLPFISYGGSALLINMAAAGILINIAMNREQGVSGNRKFEQKRLDNSLSGRRHL